MASIFNDTDKHLAVAGTTAALAAAVLGVSAYFFVGFVNGFAGEWQWASGFISFPLAVVTYAILEILLIRRTGVKGPVKVAGFGLAAAVIAWIAVSQVVGLLFSPFESALSSSLLLAFIPLAVTVLVTLAAIAMGPMIANKLTNK